MWRMAAQLVKIPEIERLSPRVIRILGGNPGKFTLQGTNTYLLGTGPQRILIDTAEGQPSWKHALSSVLAAESASISSAIITHWHYDHTGGIPDVLSLCPSAKIFRHSSNGADQPIEDGAELSVDGATISIHHTPGHAKDHICAFLKEENALFTGDNVLGQGTTVFEDLSLYLSSLRAMLELNATAAYPAHGPFIPDAEGKISEYIEHRRQREEQVVQVLAADGGGYKGSMELVKVIYKDYPENLHAPAERGVLQVLDKLVKDGLAEVDAEQKKWKLKNVQAGSGGDEGVLRAKRRAESVL